jgi:hypothetical protein
MGTKVNDQWALFTDVLESDFTTLKDISKDTDWVVQNWTVDKEASKGPYGRQTNLNNVESRPNLMPDVPIVGTGLELYVRKVKPGDEYVSVAEVDSKRTDMLYGTFRAGLKVTDVNGTCSAFFW